MQDDGTDEAVAPGAWAHFIVNVFDQEGALSGILDALKDGPPKLQQAYLNIVNMIFLESNTSPRAEDTDVDGVLLCVRKVLVKADGALSSILRLIDQGGSSAVRAKALFAAQLLCRHSPSLLRGDLSHHAYDCLPLHRSPSPLLSSPLISSC